MNSRTSNSLRNIAFGMGGQAIEVVLKFIGRTVFIKCLSVTYLGVNSLFAEILTMLSLAELGVGSAICYAMYKPLRENDEAKVSALMDLYRKAYVAVGVFVAVAGCALIPFLPMIISDAGDIQDQIVPIYLFYLFNTAITYFFSYKSSLLATDQQNHIILSAREICNTLRTVFQCIVLLAFGNFYAYLFIESLFIVVNNVIVAVYVDRKYGYVKARRGEAQLDKKEKRSIWRNIRALILVKVSTVLVNSTDNTLISIFGGIAEVGLYSNYSMFITLFNSFLGQIFGNVGASVGNLNAEGDREKSFHVFEGMHLANFWLYSWVAIGFYMLVNPVIDLWLGPGFVLPQHVVGIIAINFYMRGVMNAVWVFKDTYGLFRYGRYMTFLTALLNLLFSIALGSAYGLIGILAATCLSRLLTNIWYDPLALFRHGFFRPVWRYYVEFVAYALLGMCVCAVTWVIAYCVPLEGVVGILLHAIVVCLVPNVIYAIILRKFEGYGFIEEKSRYVLYRLQKRVVESKD